MKKLAKAKGYNILLWTSMAIQYLAVGVKTAGFPEVAEVIFWIGLCVMLASLICSVASIADVIRMLRELDKEGTADEVEG